MTCIKDNIIGSSNAPMVLTAKVPDWVFEEVEQFKDDHNLHNRNAAIMILVLQGLHACKRIDSAKFSEIAEQYCLNVDENGVVQ